MDFFFLAQVMQINLRDMRKTALFDSDSNCSQQEKKYHEFAQKTS